MKTISIPAVAFAAMAACAAFAQLPPVQPPPAPQGTVAQGAADETITAKVKEVLAADSALVDMEVTVETADAVVTLNGTARARDQINRALALARAVDGVKSVVNILAVRTS
jgi:hyperosmotically inducible protein